MTETAYSKAARYYDVIYRFKDYAGEVARLLALPEFAHAGTTMSLLDVACGSGLHIEQLGTRFHAEGLDICPELLELARRRNPGTLFHLGDMRAFNLGRRFDIILCLFSAIGYTGSTEGLRAAMRCMVQHLAPGGVLVIEPWFTPGDWKTPTVHALHIDEPELKISRINTSLARGNVSVLDLHYLVGTPSGTEHFVEHHELALFERSEMTEAMEDAGLLVRYDPEGLTGRGLYVGTLREESS